MIVPDSDDFGLPERRGGRLTDRFRVKAALVSSLAELESLMLDVVAELGFDHFALLHHSSLASQLPGLVRIDNYPAEWIAVLVGRGIAREDPVHLASVRTHAGFSWSELSELIRLGARQLDMLRQAVEFGIGDGFTVPVNIPGEPSGSCTFAVKPGRGLPAARLHCAEQIGREAFKAAKRLHARAASGKRPSLSRRERECVRLVAAGKTDWEIGAILGISVQTVHKYVKRARAAYNVVSRAQLVACALRDALVSFDEAIPPNG